MEVLEIRAGLQTPEIHLDGTNGFFRISGKSYPDNVHSFYGPVFEYLENYRQNPCNAALIEFHWLYYNTATAKIIVKMIQALKEPDTGLKIRWFYPDGVDIMKEKGIEIGDLLGVDLEVVSV